MLAAIDPEGFLTGEVPDDWKPPPGSVLRVVPLREARRRPPAPVEDSVTPPESEVEPEVEPEADPIKDIAAREPELARWLVKLSRASGVAIEEADKVDAELVRSAIAVKLPSLESKLTGGK